MNKNDKTIHHAKYSTNEFGFRNMQNKHHLSKKNIITIGCSFTFGIGVNDNETYPFFLQNLLPNYNVYNAGVAGYGLAHVVRMLELSDSFFPKNLKNSRPTFVYLLFNEHIMRTVGKVSWDQYRYPHYILKNDYPFFSHIKTNPKGTDSLIELDIAKQFLAFFGNNRYIVSGQPITIYIKLIEYMNKIINTKYQGELIVVNTESHPVLANQLYNKKIDYHEINLSSHKLCMDDIKCRLPDDHFNKTGNMALASLINDIITSTYQDSRN